MSGLAEQSLTGVWDGVFSYPRRLSPTAFTAILFETGPLLGGTIHEVRSNGQTAGQTLHATLEGRRSGSDISFVKIYAPGTAGHGRPIDYVGVLNAEATEIEGTWTVRGDWSGKFLMMRSGRQLNAEEVRARRTAPVS